jgi:four helix bundle protein
LQKVFHEKSSSSLAGSQGVVCRLNVVEGWTKRNIAANFKRHLIIAAGEAPECEFSVGLAVDEGFAPESLAQPMLSEYGKLGFMLHNLWKEWRRL